MKLELPAKLVLANTPTLLEQFAINGIGGDQVGALLLSPFIKAGSTSSVPYNHYSMLRSLEDIFRLDEHLGYAAQPSPLRAMPAAPPHGARSKLMT